MERGCVSEGGVFYMWDVGIIMSGDAARAMYRVLIGFGFLLSVSLLALNILPHVFFSC